MTVDRIITIELTGSTRKVKSTIPSTGKYNLAFLWITSNDS